MLNGVVTYRGLAELIKNRVDFVAGSGLTS
jgi:hypothetical protein